MKTIISSLLGFFLFYIPMASAGNVYSVADIPEVLIEDANVVIRKQDMQIEVISVDRAKVHTHNVITILNKKAKDYAYLAVSYSVKISKVNNITARIYDKNGKVVKKLKKSDFHDIAYPDQGSLITGNRMVVADMEHSSFPFTIEYSYDKIVAGLIRQPYWSPLFSAETALESAQLTIKTPSSLPFSYQAVNYDGQPTKATEGNLKVYTWRMENVQPIETEPYGPGFSELNPRVYITGDRVKMGKTEGGMDSWEAFGQFYYNLNKGRDELPEEMKAKVKELIANSENKFETIDILYKYLQDNTRYVSVQLGIGGWQTFDADYVYRNGYGDCKALSNYMKSMLKAADIKSHIVLVGAGTKEPPVATDFVNDPFNHVILCVPMLDDTVWLECTNSLNPTGYLGTFTEDRYVLVCTPNGGKLVKTPGSTAEMNIQFRKTNVALSPDDVSKVNVKIIQSGFQQGSVRSIAAMASEEDQKKWLERRIQAPGFKLNKFSFEEDNSTSVPTYYTDYEIEARNWASATGSRIFLSPNVLERRSSVPDRIKDRKHEVVITYSYLDRDTVEYDLPLGYSVESMPEMPLEIKSDFGEYKATIIKDKPGKLIYTRELRMKKGRLSADQYEDYRNFFREVVKADKIQVVLSNKS